MLFLCEHFVINICISSLSSTCFIVMPYQNTFIYRTCMVLGEHIGGPKTFSQLAVSSKTQMHNLIDFSHNDGRFTDVDCPTSVAYGKWDISNVLRSTKQLKN